MLEAAQQLEFEKAARLRDQVAELRAMPDYGVTDGSGRKLTRSDVDDEAKPKPGMARSKAGRTGRSKRAAR
jgi:hypothetical protein